MSTDWYPSGMDARVPWHRNFAVVLPTMQEKYNLTPEQVAQAKADADWIEYWVGARRRADALNAQLIAYFNGIAGTDQSLDQPEEVNFALADERPDPVRPGIEARARELARHLKGHSVYSEADGARLAIITTEAQRAEVADGPGPHFKVTSRPNFELQVAFKKERMAIRLEYRRKGEAWKHAAFLTHSPGVFALAPLVEGQAEQIELRAIRVHKNLDVGIFSGIHTAFISR